jgi:hypothetical protein
MESTSEFEMSPMWQEAFCSEKNHKHFGLEAQGCLLSPVLTLETSSTSKFLSHRR